MFTLLFINLLKEDIMTIYLETERLLLRPLEPADIPILARLWADPVVTKHLGGPREALSVQQMMTEDLDRVLLERYDLWPVVEKRSGQVIGHCGLIDKEIAGNIEIELTYVFFQAVWGKGYATEIGLALIDYAFNQLNLSRLVALIAPHNDASARVAQKLGFHFSDTIVRPNGKSMQIYAIETE